MKPDASHISSALTRYFKGKPGVGGNDRYLCGQEVRLSSFDSPRIADLIVQDTWTGGFWGKESEHLQYPRHGFEIKVSRSDWLAELKQPDKAMAFIPYLHYWSLAIPEDMKFEKSELPEGWGLYLISDKGARVKKSPTLNSKAIPMPEGMRISFMRRVAGMERHLARREGNEAMCRKYGHDWSEPATINPWCQTCGIKKPADDVSCETTNGDELGEIAT